MNQQFHFQVLMQSKWKYQLKRIYMHPHIHCSIIYNSQDTETI